MMCKRETERQRDRDGDREKERKKEERWRAKKKRNLEIHNIMIGDYTAYKCVTYPSLSR